jgi:hypothetical protein
MLTRRTQQLDPGINARIADRLSNDTAFAKDLQQQRDYWAGRQFIQLTDRMRQYLGGNTSLTSEDFKRLRLNIFVTVINAVVERLIVSGLTTDEQGKTAPLKDDKGTVILDTNGQPAAGTVKPVAEWASLVWRKNRMDARQRRIYETALRDSETFIVVSWDDDAKLPRFVPHPRYVGTMQQGMAIGQTPNADNFGCTAFYANDDVEQALEFVTKRWQSVSYAGGSRRTIERLTIYYPDRIEKYEGLESAWSPIMDDGDPGWPIHWVDPNTGAALGIPVVHVRSTAGFEASEAIGPQNAINKTIIDLLAAEDLTAFRIMVALGWKPVDAAGEPLTIDAGTWVGTDRQPASAMVVPGADLTNISEQVYNWIQWAAMVTDTPVARFITSKQLAAEGTQKAQDGPLIMKCRTRQSEIGNAIEELFNVARTLHNAFWSVPLLDIEAEITPQWEPLESRDEDAELARAVLKVSKLGVPEYVVWGEIGYSEAQIAQWKVEAEQRKQEQMQQMKDAQQQAAVPQNGTGDTNNASTGQKLPIPAR